MREREKIFYTYSGPKPLQSCLTFLFHYFYSELEKLVSEHEAEKEGHASTKTQVENLTTDLEQERAKIKSTKEELSQEKSGHDTTKTNLEGLKSELDLEKQNHEIVDGELKKERESHHSTKGEFENEKEQHNAAKRDLEYAQLPFWKKIGADKPV